MHSKELERYEKQFPKLTSDEAADHFLENADLSEYDFSSFKKTFFEFEPKAAQLNMRLPSSLLAAVKKSAKARGVPYTRFIREALERAINLPS